MAIGIGIGLPFRRTFAKISEQLQAKFIAWYDFSEEAASYYINRVGSQERETISDGTNYGEIHPGRAILYDSAKTQYSRTAANQPANFRLINNSLTFDFDIRIEAIPTNDSIIFWGESIVDVGNVYCFAAYDSNFSSDHLNQSWCHHPKHSSQDPVARPGYQIPEIRGCWGTGQSRPHPALSIQVFQTAKTS